MVFEDVLVMRLQGRLKSPTEATPHSMTEPDCLVQSVGYPLLLLSTYGTENGGAHHSLGIVLATSCVTRLRVLRTGGL